MTKFPTPPHCARRWSLLATSIVAAAALTACGGGSSGGDSSGGGTATRVASCGQNGGTLTVMPMGDSITEGAPGHNTYRRDLWQRLKAAGCNVDFVGSRTGVSKGYRDSPTTPAPNPDFDQDNEGHWKYRADELQSIAASRVGTAQPDVVLVHAGTNDILQGQSTSSTAADLGGLIDAIRAGKSDTYIVLAKIIPISVDQAGASALNRLIDGIASQKNTASSPVVVVDQSAGYSVGDNYDGVHPNPSGEAKMGSKWANRILAWRSQ